MGAKTNTGTKNYMDENNKSHNENKYQSNDYTTRTITIIIKKLIAGNNNNGVRVSGIETTNGPTNCRKNAWIHYRTRAEIPGEPKGNNGKHRSNPNQKKTASKARVRARTKEDNPRTMIQKGRKSTSLTSP